MLGEDGVAARVNAFAMAIQMGGTMDDLEEAELCYAPPFGSAKDPVNFAGMVAADVLRGDMPLTHWQSVDNGFLLDVRNPPELAVEQVPGALNIPSRNSVPAWANSPRPRDSCVLSVGPAGVLWDAHPAAKRVQGPECRGRHAVTVPRRVIASRIATMTDTDRTAAPLARRGEMKRSERRCEGGD